MCQDDAPNHRPPPAARPQVRQGTWPPRVAELAAREQQRADHAAHEEEEEQPGGGADHADETDRTIRREHIDHILHTAAEPQDVTAANPCSWWTPTNNSQNYQALSKG